MGRQLDKMKEPACADLGERVFPIEGSLGLEELRR